MNNDIAVTLSHDEALVLFDLFWRFQETNALTLAHNSEFVALSRISAQLDRTLVEPFAGNYRDLLAAARDRLAAGMHGVAPDVVGDNS
jgi:hypothetical protein